MLSELCKVFKNEKQAKETKMSPEERLAFHQAHSQPVMDGLHTWTWMETQLSDRLAEPNGGLGKSIKYMLSHWDKLTLFLRKAGAPVEVLPLVGITTSRNAGSRRASSTARTLSSFVTNVARTWATFSPASSTPANSTRSIRSTT